MLGEKPVEHIWWWLDDGVAVVEVLTRELNIPETALEFGGQVRAVLASRPADKVVLDFSRTSYMSSTGFAVVFDLGRETRASGIRLAVCGFSPDVKIGASIIHLGAMVPMFDTCTEAAAALRAG